MYINHNEIKIPDDKYFEILDPPNSALPKNGKILLKNSKRKAAMLTNVYKAIEKASPDEFTVNFSSFID